MIFTGIIETVNQSVCGIYTLYFMNTVQNKEKITPLLVKNLKTSFQPPWIKVPDCQSKNPGIFPKGLYDPLTDGTMGNRVGVPEVLKQRPTSAVFLSSKQQGELKRS